MSRQNTFTVIPRPGTAADPSPARPMTSKQVRKAYKASTKTPTMTRADRYKWERAEQERIRKEFEKEKAAAKARAARERKKDKEMAALEEKKRNGMPLVVVRPSQDTIARFVRGNGSGKKRTGDGEAPTPKKPAVEMPDIAEGTEEEDIPEDGKCGDFDMLLEEDDLYVDILEELDSLVEGPAVPAAKTPGDAPNTDDTPLASDEADIESNEAQEAPDKIPEESQERNEAPDKSQDAAQAEAEEEAKDTTAADIPIQPADEFVKPPLPLSAMTRHSSSPPPRHAMPPPSTQAIFTNIEEFFPTSSQQQRELEEDGETDFGCFPSPDGIRQDESDSVLETTEITTDGIISQSIDLGSSLQLDDFAELQPDLDMLVQPETQPKAPKQPTTEKPIEPKPTPNPMTASLQHNPQTPQPPPRFFTSSGSREQLSLALQRSRRTAALEEMREKERQRRDAGAALQRSKQGKAQSRKPPALQPAANTTPAGKAAPVSAANKENANPALDPDLYNDLFGSQETEYGGDWIEDVALDLELAI